TGLYALSLHDALPISDIVVVTGFLGQPATLLLHLVRRLPGADDHLAHPAHRLAVRRHHRKRAEVVQDVFGRNRLAPDAAVGKGRSEEHTSELQSRENL